MVETGLRAAQIFANTPVAMLQPPPVRSIASIALTNDDVKPLLAALGALPLPGRQLQADDVLYLWSGPASWLAIAPGDDPDFAENLAVRLAGVAAVTDQSDGRAVLRVQGPYARDALMKLLPIDLHPSVFPIDATAMTLAQHINVQIWRSGEENFDLACLRSLAGALFEALHAACREFQTGIK